MPLFSMQRPTLLTLCSSQYNADIPFEKKAAPGFYDTSEEQARVTSAPVGQTLRRLENKRKPEEEEAERKKRQKRNKEGENGAPHQTKFIAARDAQIQKLKEAESIGRRNKLMLPPAQVGEKELEDIVKIGQADDNAKALMGSTDDPSAQLLGNYEGLDRAKMARTPRTAPQRELISPKLHVYSADLIFQRIISCLRPAIYAT